MDLSVRLKRRTDNEFVEMFTGWPWTVLMRVVLPLLGCFVAFVMGKGEPEHATHGRVGSYLHRHSSLRYRSTTSTTMVAYT